MKRHMLLALVLVLGNIAYSQGTLASFYRHYATQRYMKQLMADHPEMVGERSAMERQTVEFLQYGLPDTPSIQIVFHLVGNAASEIGPSDVQAQLDALNNDFYLPVISEEEASHPAWVAEGFDQKLAMPALQFCLATEDPTGSPTSGALYVNSMATGFPVGTNLSNPLTGGSLAWDTDRYLNVWVAALEGEVAGFAQMPGGPHESDGIVLNANLFARADVPSFLAAHPQFANYTLGRTLSHLVGSYLNLYELWNEDQPCADDYVDDTPIHNAPNYNKPEYVHVSTCGDIPVEMTMNLMDNTDDGAQYMFTNGQMMRMYATLAPEGGPRRGLRAHANGCGGSHLDPQASTDGRSKDSASTGERKNMGVNLFPNPTNSGLTVMIDSPCDDIITIKVNDQLGADRFSKTLHDAVIGHTNSVYIDTNDWAPGMYVLQVKCGKETASKKILIER